VRSDKMGFMYRSWIKNQGWPGICSKGGPWIGILQYVVGANALQCAFSGDCGVGEEGCLGNGRISP
jgi:hypothetical protein